jgi:hypothetical protein
MLRHGTGCLQIPNRLLSEYVGAQSSAQNTSFPAYIPLVAQAARSGYGAKGIRLDPPCLAIKMGKHCGPAGYPFVQHLS